MFPAEFCLASQVRGDPGPGGILPQRLRTEVLE